MKTENHVLRLACEPIPTVRIGIVGLGNRGMRAARRYAFIRGARIAALADSHMENVDAAAEELKRKGFSPARKYYGKEGWKNMCADGDIDLIYICTPWNTHADIACHAMQCGIHAAVEVPAAVTAEECRKLVATAEKTRRHCFMLENCCYDPFALATMRMADEGKLGIITHAEGAYIHHVMDFENGESKPTYQLSAWNINAFANHGGNPYPTHGLGPICLTLGIHRGDRMKQIVSLSSYAPSGTSAKINTSIITTERGRTILLVHDVETPRPYSRFMTTCGTKGFTQKYPRPCIMFDGDTEEEAYSKTEERENMFEHEVTKRWGHEARAKNIDNEMNYVMDSRLIYCLNNGLPLDMDVYDAAEWSVISELSEISARSGGMPVDIPDFTKGMWKNNAPHKFYF